MKQEHIILPEKLKSLPSFILIFFFILVNAPFSKAKEPYQPERIDPLAELWRYTHFSELDGKGIRSFAKDQNGNYWFGVNNGVIRYDGFSFKLFSQQHGLVGKDVDNLLVTKDNRLFATTSAGIYYFKDNHWERHFPVKGNYNFSFKSLKQLSDGTLACGTSEGLLLLNDKENILLGYEGRGDFLQKQVPGIRLIPLPGKFFNYTDVSDILEIENGRLWIALSMVEFGKIIDFSLADLKDGVLNSATVYDKESGVYLGENQKMLLASDKRIWIINNSYKVGINCFDGKSWKHIQLKSMFGGDEYNTSISEGIDGTIWIGGLGKLYTYHKEHWKMYKSPEYNIPSSQITVFPENDGKLWLIGLQSKMYLADLSENTWKSYGNLNYQFSDPGGAQWFISVDGKVVVHNNGLWHSFEEEDGLMDAPVKLIYTTKGQVWAAGSHRGSSATAVLDRERWKTEVHHSLSWGIDYRAVFEAKDGSIWFGSSVDYDLEKKHLSGVLQLKDPLSSKHKWIHHKSMQNGLDQSSFYGIAQSKDGQIWIGGAKLFKYNTKWSLTDNDNFQQFVNIVTNDKDNVLYVGSRYYGLFIYDGKNWRQHSTDNGLESNTIISIAVNQKKHIYVVSDNDISYYDGQIWSSHVFPSEMNMSNEGGDIKITQDGLIWINKSPREWKRRALNNSHTSSDAFKGFKTFCYKPDQNPPDTKIALFTKEVSKEGNTTIGWEGQDFLNKTPVSRLQYSYRLNKGGWSSFSNEKLHTFLGLESGDYMLEVKARDLDFNVDTSVAKAEFSVLTPIWKQTWFLGLISGFIILFIVLEIRIINKNKKLSSLNLSLQSANNILNIKNEQIEEQNKVILKNHIQLEETNDQLENKNHEIESQRDSLQEMVEKVEVLSKAKTRFFTNITHEFRTPLTLIQGPVDRLFLEKLNNQEKNQLYGIVKRNIKRLQNLINQLLEIRNIETGSLQLSLKKENIVGFLAEIKELFSDLADQKEITFIFNPRQPVFDLAFDHDKVEKIVLNLLSNAFKYTPPKGKIELKFYSETFQDKVYAVIEVCDNGKGIASENLETIFLRYNSVTIKTPGDGVESTGIGLSYIKELVEFHQGKIEVKSELGKGAVFSVYIPGDLIPQHTEEESAFVIQSESTRNSILITESSKTESEDFSTENGSIVIVEDNMDMKVFLKEILKGKFNIIEASNGLEALEACQNYEVELIISDIMMPEMNGLTLCQQIKSNFETSHIPVILLTARNREEHKIEGYEHGADGYIEKPFNPHLLFVRIENLLHEREKLRLKFSQDFNFRPKEVQVISEDEKFLKKLVEIMEANISENNFDVDKMAEMLNKSHVQFIRKVKQLTGKKPVDLLKTFRLQRSKQLLDQQKLTVSEVAYRVGYDLPNSFSRAFRKEFGLSPSEYLDNKESV